MAAQFQWFQEAGSLSGGSPARGKFIDPVNALTYKSVDNTDDDVSRDPSNLKSFITNPIPVGENSFVVYLFGRFSGSWNTLNNVKWAHNSGLIPSVFLLLARVTSTYVVPTRRAFLARPQGNKDATTLDRIVNIDNFNNLSPEQRQLLLDLGLSVNALINSGLFPEDIPIETPVFTSGGDYNFTLPRNVEYGAPVNLALTSPADPETANFIEFSQTQEGVCFTQYLVTQLFADSSAPPGVLGPITFILRYDET